MRRLMQMTSRTRAPRPRSRQPHLNQATWQRFQRSYARRQQKSLKSRRKQAASASRFMRRKLCATLRPPKLCGGSCWNAPARRQMPATSSRQHPHLFFPNLLKAPLWLLRRRLLRRTVRAKTIALICTAHLIPHRSSPVGDFFLTLTIPEITHVRADPTAHHGRCPQIRAES